MGKFQNIIISLAFVTLPVFAHHASVGRYDAQEIIEIEGVIESVRWRNPHAVLNVLVTDENGTV